MSSDDGHKHLVDLVGVSLTLEKCEEHSSELLRGNEAFLVLYAFIELLSQIVEDSIVEVQSVDLFDDAHPALWLVTTLILMILQYFLSA